MFGLKNRERIKALEDRIYDLERLADEALTQEYEGKWATYIQRGSKHSFKIYRAWSTSGVKWVSESYSFDYSGRRLELRDCVITDKKPKK